MFITNSQQLRDPSSYQSIKLNFFEIHSLATPPSPPPIIAALSLSLFRFQIPHQQKLSYTRCSSEAATCISPSINNDLPNCSNSRISIC